MALSNGNITVEPVADRQLAIAALWEDYSSYSVEAITANRAGVYDFAEQDCMYFAAVKRSVQVPVDDDDDDLMDSADGTFYSWQLTTSDHSQIYESVTGKKLRKNFKIYEEIIGIVYITSADLPACVNLGCCIKKDLRGQGLGSQAVRLLLGWVFEELGCHRVQVRIADADPARRNKAISTLLSMGFFHEGLHRRALFSPRSKEETAVGQGGEWRDVLTYAMLDTDWVIQAGMTHFPPSLVKVRWEELFRRHDRERSETLQFEEHQEGKARKERAIGKQPLRRTTSTETIKDKAQIVHDGLGENLLQNSDEATPPVGLPRDDWNSEDTKAPAASQHWLDDILHAALMSDQPHSLPLLQSNPPTSPGSALRASMQGHRDPFTSKRFRSVSPSGSSQTEDNFQSSANSPVVPRSPALPHSPLIQTLESESDSEWDSASVPRSPSVSSSNGSSSSWDNFDWETSSADSLS